MFALQLCGLLGILAGLAACTADPSANTACAPSVRQEIPYQIRHNALLVQAAVNGVPMAMEIDTGAEKTMLDMRVATALHLLPDENGPDALIQGIGGRIATRPAWVRTIEIGGQPWLQHSLTVAIVPQLAGDDPPVAGLLGGDWLQRQDMEIDLQRHRLVLWTVTNCGGDFVPWTEPHQVIPMTRAGNVHSIVVTIAGQELDALVDWGARTSAIQISAARRLGVTASMLDTDLSKTSRGVTIKGVEAKMHRFADVRIGSETIPSLAMQVGDFELGPHDMLLGMNYVAGRRVWLSYATSQMFVTPRHTLVDQDRHIEPSVTIR